MVVTEEQINASRLREEQARQHRIRTNCMAVIQRLGRREAARLLHVDFNDFREKVVGKYEWSEPEGLEYAHMLGLTEELARSADITDYLTERFPPPPQPDEEVTQTAPSNSAKRHAAVAATVHAL